jgi:hypothetical protein
MKPTIDLAPDKGQIDQARSIAESVLESGDRTFFLTSPIIHRLAKEDPFWKKPLHESKLNFILDSIIRQRIGVARLSNKRASYVDLYSKITERFCTSHFSASAKRFLLKNGIIESDGIGLKGIKSTGYRPSEATWKAGISTASIYPGQIEKYNRIHRDLKGRKNKDITVSGVDLDYLTGHLLKLELPRDSLLKELESDYLGVIETGDWKKAEAFHAKGFQISAVMNHRWVFSRCRAGRLHYPLTNLGKGIRNRLRYQGERLFEADVSCCQPLIASTLYPEGEEYSAERESYLQSVQSGLFYEELGRRADYEGSRDALKKDVLKWIFFGGQTYECKWGMKVDHSLWKAFSEMFPLLASVLALSKAEIITTYNPFKGDSNLAIRLQKAESKIFIGSVLKGLAENYRDVPAFPIHDCMITTKENLDLVSGMIRSEFAKQLGVTPTVKGFDLAEGGNKLKKKSLKME